MGCNSGDPPYTQGMRCSNTKLKHAVAAFGLSMCLAFPAAAQDRDLDTLFDALKITDPSGAAQVEQKIWEEWSKSGSPAMDILLERGRAALSEGDFPLAIEHFTALIDHAPEFAEGYNGRATAYFQADLYGPSLDDIRTTLRLNPRHFGALAGLGLILEELKMYDGALEAYRAVEAIHPNREGLRENIERLEKEVEGQAL